MIVDEVAHHLEELPATVDLVAAREVLVVVDRLDADPARSGRLAEPIAVAFSEGDGIALALRDDGRHRFTEHPSCSRCDTPAAVVTPALFSFNNPRGACPPATALGRCCCMIVSLVVPDPARSLARGASRTVDQATL